jgi:predicted O-methyltransferase YrrM
MGLKRAISRLLPSPSNRLRRDALACVEQELTEVEIELLESTPGCLNYEQGALLYYLAVQAPEGGRVVEIGSFLGKSTLWLATGLRRLGPPGRPLLAIDPHDGHERPEVCPERDSFTTFQDHVRRAGLDAWVEPLRRRSQEVAAGWSEPIRLLWIDGSHVFEDVMADLEGFVPHVIPGGYIALHDTRSRHFPGVRKAMLTYFARTPDCRCMVGLRNMVVYRRVGS